MSSQKEAINTLMGDPDIRNGKCVRSIQGDYEQEIIYGDSPTENGTFVGKTRG